MSDTLSPVPKGLGGWLTVFILGLAFTVLRINYLLFTTYLPIFRDGTWQALTTPGSDNYHAYWAPLLSFEIVGNIAVIGLAVLTLVFMLQKRKLAPRLAIACLATSMLVVLVDYIAADLIPVVAEQDNQDAMRELIRSAFGAMVWIPYFLVSKRVKATFVE